ncbi:MAG: alpha-glucan phosphorylase [Bacteroides sp. SM23_62]|nr:MAG: alpha-glucan phosphorylase [Bacteroides sp. SM23_62]
MAKQYLTPDYLFEVSWEVCNKVGGIHTVISTKAKSLQAELQDRHILIGPDVWRDSGENPEFEEDKMLFQTWKQHALGEGLRIKVGRWKITGRPIAVILDFTTFMAKKDKIFSKLWENFQLDSISGQWDYIEPCLFGYAAGKVIESYTQFYLNTRTRVVAQFHEWMTGAGVLYLKEKRLQIATTFTTHATVIGRSIAGNRLPLYGRLEEYDGDDKSNDFNVVSKQSLEKLAAANADAFTTVSKLTSRECTQFLKKDVSVVTPNGFEDSFVPEAAEFTKKRQKARELLMKVAGLVSHQSIGQDALLIATSGRYEFRNKGLDVFLDALSKVKHSDQLNRDIVAFLLIPAHHYGPRKDLVEAMKEEKSTGPQEICCLTHHLHHPEYDPILNKIRDNGLENKDGSRVKIVFVPSYLQGNDGIFNLPYYDLLIGFDLTVFASYYEPWGYTPLESLAFSIPSVTTTLAGFGLWVKEEYGDVKHGIVVVERDDNNYSDTVDGIAKAIITIAGLDQDAYENARKEAWEISRIALWENLVEYYWQAYGMALDKARRRTNLFFDRERPGYISEKITAEPPDWKKFEVREMIPEKLNALEDIAMNLYWSWDEEATAFFRSIDPDLWEEANHNPILAARSLPLSRFKELEEDKEFIREMNRIHKKCLRYTERKKEAVGPRIAYFSMEYGIHDSLKTYSGGLGLLAGDYLKEASDYNRNLVGVGLLYRYGYFTQIVSASGEQISADIPQDFSRIPVRQVRDEHGNWQTISIQMPGRTMKARIWRVDVGRVELYLLDTDFEENIEQDRRVTHHLYGGDLENRFKQELLLGVGGIRLLQTLGIEPDLYHCNEGHAAFIGLERLRRLISEQNLSFPEALELVRSSTLYTTHTPVPAGHDSFEEGLVRMYMSHYPDRLNISWEQFIGLGRLRPEDPHEKFSMSYLAINLSQEVNGVSRLHGKVTQHMFNDLWKGYNPDELHIGYVTNGVHFPTWTAPEWSNLYRKYFGEDFVEHQYDLQRWQKIYEVDEKEIWDLRNSLRDKMIQHVKSRIKKAAVKRLEDPRIIMEVEEKLSSDVLTIGFARRFATYKRANLLFRDPERLARIINDPEKPVQFIFAGKAHPNDKAGQELIKFIIEKSKQPEFIGRIMFLQNYDISLAQKLVQGVDIWLNTPTRPLEASGTSGEKAVMNGCLHFSVLDGWWAEGYREGAGWALPEERTYENQPYQDELDAETIYTLLEDEITNMFYKRRTNDVPLEWIRTIKNSIAQVAPNFTMNRMFRDYEEKFYHKLHERSQKMKADDLAMVRDLSSWKRFILRHWDGINIVGFRHPDVSRDVVSLGDTYSAEVVLELNELDPSDIGVEIVIPDFSMGDDEETITFSKEFELVKQENGQSFFSIEVTPARSGVLNYGIRIFPRNVNLPHRQDFALVKWA